MPTYDYQCSSCESNFQCFESISDNIENPPTHCPKCDPEEEREGTLFRYFGNSMPAFKIHGDGVYRSGIF